MTRNSTVRAFVFALAVIAAAAAFAAPSARAQGSRKDDIIFGPSGHPVSGATIRVCTPAATGTPCSPLATIYTDATLTVAAPNPFQSDGIGNYHFYAPAGRYELQITGPGITGTVTYPDIILPADLSSNGSGNDISAFGLTLGGNLSVGGNATITGTLNTTNFNPGSFTPSSLSVGGNETVQGPRPRVDVTAFGATGTGAAHDDTAAIAAAIAFACANNNATVFFPPAPAYYRVTQTQTGTSATAAIFPMPCDHLHLQGANSAIEVPQFSRAPAVAIVAGPGASPNPGPIFSVNGHNGITIENFDLVCVNQCIYWGSADGSGTAAGNNRRVNVNAAVFAPSGIATTAQPNAADVIGGSLWTFFEGGTASSNLGTSPSIVILNDFIEQPGIISMRDMTLVGCIEAKNITSSGTGNSGNWHFWNVTAENCGNGFLIVDDDGVHPWGSLSDLSFDFSGISDANYTSYITLNSGSGSSLYGVTVNQLQSNGQFTIRLCQGTASFIHTIGGASLAGSVGDCSGNMLGPALVDNGIGQDFIASPSGSILNSSRTDIEPQGIPSGGALRTFVSGAAPQNSFAVTNVDPSLGYATGLTTTYGPEAAIKSNAAASMDVMFPGSYAPASVSATPAITGGATLAANTYYYFASAVTGTASCSGSLSAPSLAATAVVSGANNSAIISWTPSANPGTGAVNGYCIERGITGQGPHYAAAAQYNTRYVSGAGTTTYTDIGTGLGGAVRRAPVATSFTGAHRFTATSLGVNTANPQSNLDVNGSAAVNSLNLVQKAERFAGSDSAAKINACLTAASTTSSVCDARGMIGTLTGSAHIAIPAGTTLLWGQGQLTITDSSTNDAIELMGDGASLYGYQESGLGTIAAPDTSGFIACATAGCTTVHKPNAATSKINYVHVVGMYLGATGANSKVVDLTSIGHSIIESNNLALGTGGTSYGVFGDTSTGGFDGTNSLIRHNNIGLNSAGDTCVSLAGVYNAIVIEQNVCTLAPASSFGYVFKKDSSGNYPDNDEIYGNDCESSSAAFGQVCYNIIGALSITFGPNNRCEKVYNCLQFPSDGSANGIHVLDPYLSISNTNQINPNEPATSTIAIDNNGHNWLPSMHYGMNDLSDANLLGNSGFEGWQNSTALYYWGGVSGTNINQAGSGIYLQETSAGANPGVDTYTQGLSNVRVGDGATAGLGVNSACVQVDSTREYTLMFRVASGSTSNNFRPGFRFYWDANCTEADRITTASSNARVLAPVNYSGTSTSTGNWQSTNASLTYNNGITCNCNVTGADWQVSTASAWTPTRNFGVIFRVPNAYGVSTTVTHSMRVFLLENTAAASNYVYFDDVILNQGPVTPDIRSASVRDSGTPAVYGSLAISQHLNQGASGQFAGTVALVGGTATVTFPTPFASTPVCVANDQSAIATVKVTPSATALTLTQSSGTDTINWLCVGNPN